MGKLAFLPRTLIGRTPHGSVFFYDRKLGVMGEGPVIGWGLRPISMHTLRTHGDVWWEWTKLAWKLPPDAPRFTVPDDNGGHQGGGGRAA